jgi:hypothetical protein
MTIYYSNISSLSQQAKDYLSKPSMKKHGILALIETHQISETKIKKSSKNVVGDHTQIQPPPQNRAKKQPNHTEEKQ